MLLLKIVKSIQPVISRFHYYPHSMQSTPQLSETSSDPPQKRRRIKQACDYCRSKKAKCDGKAPSCTNCITSNEECVYSQPSKRRGLPSGYTHSLEKRILLFKGILVSLIQDDKLIESKLLNLLYNSNILIEKLEDLETVWEVHNLSQLFDQVFQDNNASINITKSNKPTANKTITTTISNNTNNLKTDNRDVSISGNSPNPSINDSARLAPVAMLTSVPGGLENQVQSATSISTTTTTTTAPPLPLQLPAHGQRLATSGAPPLLQQQQQQQLQIQIASPNQQDPIQPSPNSAFGSFIGNNNYPSTPSPAVSDPSFFFNYDVFQFISDEIEGADDSSPENWEPVALQYHGMSSLISGFTNKVVQQYNSKINNVFKNPFRVGSIFNVSSFAINASMSQNARFPDELFEFPANVRELMDVYFLVPHCLMPMLDKVSFIRHMNYLLGLPTRKRKAVDGNMLALVWAVLALGEFSMFGGDCKTAALYAKYSTMALENSFTTTIETIQAMIILGLTYYHLGQWDFSWVLISSGTRMAVDVRLMRNASDDDPKLKFQSSASLNNINRQRTWATVFLVNTLLCARMGRSPVVRAHDWPVPQINSDGWEEWQPWEFYYSSDIPKLEHGKFLSIFNEVLKGIAIVNLAITATIDTTVFQGGEIKYDDRQNSQSMSLEMFNARIENWKAQLPEHCQVEYYGKGAIPPPPVILLHVLGDLIWCILAVRLSSLKSNNEIKDKIIKFRNQKYTRAIISIKRFLNDRTVHILHHYFLFDYYLVMAFNFPDMMDFESELIKQSHICEMRNVLLKAASYSVPCRVSWDLFTIMNNTSSNDIKDTPKNNFSQDTPTAQESPMISNLLNEPITIKPEPVEMKAPKAPISVPQTQQVKQAMLPGIIPYTPTNAKSWVHQLPPPTATTLTLPVIGHTQNYFAPDANLLPMQHPVHQLPLYQARIPSVDQQQQQQQQHPLPSAPAPRPPSHQQQ